MKKIIVLFLSLVMILSFCSCGGNENQIPEDDGIVDNIIIDGEEVSAVDFVTESCSKFLQSEKYLEVKEYYKETQGESLPFVVTRVVDLKAYEVGSAMVDIHYMLIKADCSWATEKDGLFSEIILVADYDTGMVWSSLDCDESWFGDDLKKEHWTYIMLNSCFVSSDYENDPIIGSNVETRAEFTTEDLSAVNAGIVQ